MKVLICSVSMFFMTLLCIAQNDYHNYLLNKFEQENGLTGGTFVLGNNEQDKMNLINNYGEGARDAPLNNAPTEVPFNNYFEYNIANRLLSPSGVGTLLQSTTTVNNGDALVLVFWMKGISDVIGGNGVARIGVNDGSSDLYIEYKFFNDEWTEYIIPINAVRNIDAGNMRFSISWGHQAQQVQFGGLALINYGNTNVRLPSLNHQNYYNGAESNASWRADAQSRIEQYRKANLTVEVVDQNGNPIPNANVKVDMDEHEFGFGSAVQAQLIARSHPDFDQDYVNRMLNLDGRGHGFNEILFENALKWHRWENNQPFNLTKAQKVEALRFLKEEGIRIRGHSLLWPGPNHMPQDVEENLSNTNFVRDRIKNHINDILNYDGIKNNMIDWDVINEITTNRLVADALGSRTIYQDVMRWAKESLPNAKLYLNDFMTISYGGLDINGPGANIGDYDQYDTCIEYLKEIDDAGVPFDGIGFQAHIRNLPIGPPTVYGILEDFNQKFGKDMKITEFDMIAVPPAIQKQYLNDFLTAVFSHPKVKSFIMWGFTDEHHWLDNSPIFDRNRNLKPGGEAFINLVFNEWWTNEQTNSNSNGQANIRAFKGKHTITVEHNGEVATYDVELTGDRSVQINLDVEGTDPVIPESNIYYVSNSGNDNNIGSEVQPWKTIQHAANVLSAGETVIIKSGIYSEYVILRNSGNSTDGYINFIGEDKATVIMQGSPDLQSAFESLKSSYINIENITIKDYHQEGIAFYKSDNFKRNIRLKNLDVLNSGYERGLNCPDCWDHGIRIAKVENFLIDQCYVYNSWASNIYVVECSRGAIINTTANGPENGILRDESDGISIQNSKRVSVQNCIANYNFEDGIDIGGQNGSDIKHIRVSNCVSNYNYGDGLSFSVTNGTEFDGYDVTFANCLSAGNGEHGLTCYAQPDNVKIVHNTVVNNKWGLKIENENPKNFIIKNNIFSGNESSNFIYDDISTNVFQLSNTNWYGRVPTDSYRGSTFQNEDPLVEQDFELNENSPCIDFGETLTQTTSSGSGNIVPVKRVDYFNDGFDVIPGDLIQIGDRQVQIISISPNDKTLRLSENISWNNNDPVSFVYSGNAPDLGWKESLSTRGAPDLLGDVNCDGEVNSIDALFVLQFDVGSRIQSSTCPPQNPANEIYLGNADVNNDGSVNSTAALLILQCDAGIANVFCENAGNRLINQGGSIHSGKRLKVFPNLFQDFITVQYESDENLSLPKMAYITNINNQAVRQIEIPNQSSWSSVINVSDLTPGLYTVMLIDGAHKEILKLIKN